MDDKFYYNKFCKISEHANKLHSYLHVLRGYAESNYDTNGAVSNILDILDLSVCEIDNIVSEI